MIKEKIQEIFLRAGETNAYLPDELKSFWQHAMIQHDNAQKADELLMAFIERFYPHLMISDSN